MDENENNVGEMEVAKLKFRMKSSTYYGEYSLEHWINLIERGNIRLPWYQRSFVWDKEQIFGLIESLENDQFVPPVIIGAVKENGKWTNYVLDGQQRLTSILFAKHNKYIDKNIYSEDNQLEPPQGVADDLTEEEDDEHEEYNEKIKIINWTFRDIVGKGETEWKRRHFIQLFNEAKADDFFERHYIGFAYIKPENDVQKEDQSKFYSEVFRNINTRGTKLTRMEIRRSLYFLREDLKYFFAPDFLGDVKVETSSRESGQIDFIKYLSILAQKKSICNLYRYGGRNWERNEEYYKAYISSIVNNRYDYEYRFDISFPGTPYLDSRMKRLGHTISDLGIPHIFNSIIDLDMYFFGLVNEIVFCDRDIDIERKDDLKKDLENKISEWRDNDRLRKNPNALKYLRSRIDASVWIYEKYVK